MSHNPTLQDNICLVNSHLIANIGCQVRGTTIARVFSGNSWSSSVGPAAGRVPLTVPNFGQRNMGGIKWLVYLNRC